MPSDTLPPALDPDPGAEVRQPVGAAGGEDGSPAVGVEAEEVDPRLAADTDVGADVQLREAGEERRWQSRPQAQALDAEGGDAEPGAAVMGVERQPFA